MNSQISFTIFLALIIWSCNISGNAADEKALELLYRLRSTYHFKANPISDAPGSEPLKVKLGVSLVDIVEADESTNELVLVLWKTMKWNTKFGWDPESARSYNISMLRVPAEEIWMPDVVVYRVTEPTQELYPDINVLLQPNGEVWYITSQRICVRCDLDGLDSDEGSLCAIKFGSWSYTGNLMDLREDYNPGMGLDLVDYHLSSSYELLNTTSIRHEVVYTCCPGEPYVDVTYYIKLRKRRSKKGFFSSWF